MHAVVTAVTIQFNKTVSNEVKEPSCKMAHYQSHITEKNKLFGQPNTKAPIDSYFLSCPAR